MSKNERRVALVTGASRGIGLATARRLAEQGHAVVLVDRLAEVENVAAKMSSEGADAIGILADLGEEKAAKELIAEAVHRRGRLDILVNNAGITIKNGHVRHYTHEIPLDDWERTLRVNLTVPFLLCRECVPLMREREWGRIINISSAAARGYSKYAPSHYVASKMGLIGFSRILAGETGQWGITVNCVAPGRTQTPMNEVAAAAFNEAALKELPVGRLGTPDDIAGAVAYLASEDAGFITGAVLDVNGGSFMN